MGKAFSIWKLGRLKNGNYMLAHVIAAPIGSGVAFTLPADFRFTLEERRQLRLDAYACARRLAEENSELGHA